VESHGHGREIDPRAPTPSKPGSEDDSDAGADGDKTIRGEPEVAVGDSGLRLGAPARNPANEALTGSTSSSVSVPASVSGLPRSTAPQSAAVRSSTVGVSKPSGLAKNLYITRGGSSNKGVPLADRNLVSRTRKAR
jgi:hypothetical protein